MYLLVWISHAISLSPSVRAILWEVFSVTCIKFEWSWFQCVSYTNTKLIHYWQSFPTLNSLMTHVTASSSVRSTFFKAPPALEYASPNTSQDCLLNSATNALPTRPDAPVIRTFFMVGRYDEVGDLHCEGNKRSFIGTGKKRVLFKCICDPTQQKGHLVGQVHFEIMNQIVCKI